MLVHILSPDPDFRSLLDFMLRFHGFAVAAASFDSELPAPPGAEPPTVLIADLSDEEMLFGIAAIANRYDPESVLLVLSKAGQLMACARQLLPHAAAYLLVPVVPRELVACVRALSTNDAVAGYTFMAPSLDRPSHQTGAGRHA